jgi:hypothetical protein
MKETAIKSSDERTGRRLFWIVALGGLLSLMTGGTLFFVSQRGSFGARGGVGPGVRSATYTRNQLVNIWRNDSWLPGEVIEPNGERYRVRYERHEVFSEEWVDSSRLQPR